MLKQLGCDILFDESGSRRRARILSRNYNLEVENDETNHLNSPNYVIQSKTGKELGIVEISCTCFVLTLL